MFSKFLLNPAVAGSEKFLEIGMWNRSQWTGFEGAPSSQAISIQSSFFKKKSGVGGYIINDKAGPTSNTGINLSYAYHIPLTRDLSFSLGLGTNISKYSVNGNKLELYHSGDPLLNQNVITSTIIPEASAGTFLYHRSFYFGFSVLNLTEYKTPIFNDLGTNANMARQRHFNVIGSYKYKIEKGLYFIPSFYINKVVNNPTQAEINIRLNYRHSFQLGFTYRTSDALAFLIDLKLLQNLYLSYSYDIQYSELKSHSMGSHEIMLRYQFFYNEIYKKIYQTDHDG